jgi:hypothetical protein
MLHESNSEKPFLIISGFGAVKLKVSLRPANAAPQIALKKQARQPTTSCLYRS